MHSLAHVQKSRGYLVRRWPSVQNVGVIPCKGVQIVGAIVCTDPFDVQNVGVIPCNENLMLSSLLKSSALNSVGVISCMNV